MGGLKGKMAPGDAHPYLALFYLILLTFLAQTVDFESARGRDEVLACGELFNQSFDFGRFDAECAPAFIAMKMVMMRLEWFGEFVFLLPAVRHDGDYS
jgi:hypothetical protein